MIAVPAELPSGDDLFESSRHRRACLANYGVTIEERWKTFGFEPVFDTARQLGPCNVHGLYRCFVR